ncbi:MAG: hypothetical protein GTO18_10165 [Anaerolineales bacterium]|nr:hypothetical protein [Anaerolineales bacterium]
MSKPWYEQARVHFGWVRYGEPLTHEYAKQVIQKTLALGANTLAFCVQAGGYALWDSAITPRADELGSFNLIGELAGICKEHDLHFVPWWLGTAPGVARVLREHSSWQQVGPPNDVQPGQRYEFVCYNSPYRELLYEEVREILERYDVSGVYFNQLPASCYCPWCHVKFERLYGNPMPIITNEPMLLRFAVGLPRELQIFREESIRSFCMGVRKIIDEVRPGACYIQDWLWDFHSELALGSADVILPEFYQKDDLLKLGLKCRLTKAYFNRGPIWSNVRHAVDHDARHHPIQSTQLLLANCLSNLASPLLSEQDSMDFDSAGMEELRETFEYIEHVQDHLEAAEPVTYAALFHSGSTQRLFGQRYEEAFEGVYNLLVKAHIPLEIVNEVGIARGELDRYKVLVVPDAVALLDGTIKIMCDAVSGGLGIVATHMTAWTDEEGCTLENPAFSDLFRFQYEDIVATDTEEGFSRDPLLNIADLHSHTFIWHYGSLSSDPQVTMDLSHEALFGFLGGYVRGSAMDDAHVLAYVHSHDHMRMNAKDYNRRGIYPGAPRWPLAVASKQALGRAVYYSPQIEAEWRRAHAPELTRLFEASILWAGGPLPFITENIPWSVDVRQFHNPKNHQDVILLVNLTTNPPIDVGRGPGAFQSITPQRSLQLSIPLDRDVTDVKSFIGDVQSTIEDGILSIELPVLDLYDMITVKYR